MSVVCLDLEGVLVPEIWIEVSKRTGVRDLSLTTRDIPDYDVLMRRRISILRREGIRLRDIQNVISKMAPLPGARAFLDSLRAKREVLILSDTFYEFAGPLMKKLGYPVLFCNWLIRDQSGFIYGYKLRQKDGKAKCVRAIKRLGFKVTAAGDSYNDIKMLQAADWGVFFKPPAKITKQHPDIPVTRRYPELMAALIRH